MRQFLKNFLIFVLIIVAGTLVTATFSFAPLLIEYISYKYGLNPIVIRFGLIFTAIVAMAFLLTMTAFGRNLWDAISKSFFRLSVERNFYEVGDKSSRSGLKVFLGRDDLKGRDLSEVYSRHAEADIAAKISAEDKEEIASRAKAIAIEQIGEQLQREINEGAENRLKNLTREKALARLGSIPEVLGERANWSLTIGLGFCLFGLLALFGQTFFLPESLLTARLQGESLNWLFFAVNYLPRLSVVIIVEVIGLFFLRLYTRTLSEIRYFQNELTNVEMKLIGLDVVLDQSDIPAIQGCISELSSTERNSILEKGQTTTEIERERVQVEAHQKILEALPNIIHGSGKSSVWKSGQK